MLEKTEHVGLYHSTFLQSWAKGQIYICGAFVSSHMPKISLHPPQTTLDACIQNFSPVLTLRNKVREGGPQAIFEKDALFYEGHPKITENYE